MALIGVKMALIGIKTGLIGIKTGLFTAPRIPDEEDFDKDLVGVVEAWRERVSTHVAASHPRGDLTALREMRNLGKQATLLGLGKGVAP